MSTAAPPGPSGRGFFGAPQRQNPKRPRESERWPSDCSSCPSAEDGVRQDLFLQQQARLARYLCAVLARLSDLMGRGAGRRLPLGRGEPSAYPVEEGQGTSPMPGTLPQESIPSGGTQKTRILGIPVPSWSRGPNQMAIAFHIAEEYQILPAHRSIWLGEYPLLQPETRKRDSCPIFSLPLEPSRSGGPLGRADFGMPLPVSLSATYNCKPSWVGSGLLQGTAGGLCNRSGGSAVE